MPPCLHGGAPVQAETWHWLPFIGVTLKIEIKGVAEDHAFEPCVFFLSLYFWTFKYRGDSNTKILYKNFNIKEKLEEEF